MQQKEPKLCKKCKTNKPSIIIQKDPVCQECFIGYVEHMFKMSLRLKCNITQKNEKLLICFSGGQNSTALVKMTSDVVYSTCAHNKSKMFIQAHVLYINESFIMKEFIQEYQPQDYIPFLTNECKLPFQTIDIQSIYPDPYVLLQQLHNLSEFGSSREDFVRLIKLHIIYDYAIKNGFQNICFGQNGQRLAADLFSQLSKGRGLSLQSATKYNYSFVYPINQNKLQILHPLKDLLNKDILYYLRLKSNINFPNFILGQHLSHAVKNKPANGNIDHLLEQFIDKLQEGFPSTTFTVLSSADKITLKPLLQQNYCPLCLEIRDQVYNRLEVETLDNSNQQLINHLRNNTKYYNKICFTCNRMLQSARELEKFYNLQGFPPLIIQLADLIQ
ncbi:unnamed protein product [Paramecium sonneborni]|uniref:Cytoplasmic tRNA 2-thiolation protein 2 n=1 Tax=Paramecium sonneborni TaxID=65129 RepID=A0A8S1LVM9_9CILI|nr:unnamed protein product [Paramecium sonneborni]